MTTSDRDKQNARQRARRKIRNADVGAEIEVLYKPLDEWDDEEIRRGRPRDKNGGWGGRRPRFLTPALEAERLRRAKELLTYELAGMASEAQKVLLDLLTDTSVDDFGKPRVPASVKADVAKFAYEQFMGKAKTSVDVTAGNPLRDLMADILVNPDGGPSHQIIEGEVVEDPSARDDRPNELPGGRA